MPHSLKKVDWNEAWASSPLALKLHAFDRPVRWGGSGGSNEPTRLSNSSTFFARLPALTFRSEKVSKISSLFISELV